MKTHLCGRPFVVTLFALLIGLPLSRATPPTPPAQIELAKEYLGEKVELTGNSLSFRVKSNAAVTGVEFAITQREVVAGKAVFERPEPVALLRQSMKAREFERYLNFQLKPPHAGSYLIEIRLKGVLADKSGFSDRLTRYAVVDTAGKITLFTPQEFQRLADQKRTDAFTEENRKDSRHHPIRLLFDDTAVVPATISRSVKPLNLPEKQQMVVRPEGPSEFLRKHSVDSTATSWSSQDNLTIRGRLLFQDIDGVWKPLVNVSVNIWDSDFLSDENLGVVATGWDGRWSFTCNDDDGWLQDGRDIYYTFKLENTRLSVGSCSFASGPYEWKSVVHDDLPDGTVLDFGDETASTNMEALQVWSTLNLAWNHAVVVGGWDPGKVDACYPGSGTFYNGNLNVLGSDNDGPDSITHEYGHALMSHAYVGGDPSPGGPHGFGDCGQNQSLSWSEGWATAFMLSARPDGTYNWHEGDGGQAIEAFSSSCHVGETSEGWVAAALLDMMDANDDDNGGNQDRGRDKVKDHNTGNQVALATMLRDTMVGSHHDNVLDFWYSLVGELNSTQGPLGQEIMYYNWMSVLAPSSCVATKVATQHERDPEATLTGLRTLRDKALKNWRYGRQLINTYYRSSPEIALRLLSNPSAIPDALKVMHYFSGLGLTISDHNAYMRVMEQNPEVIPDDVGQSIENVFKLLDDGGSDDLRESIKSLRRDIAALHGVHLQEFQEKITKEKASDREKPLPVIQQANYSDGSKAALQDKRLQEFIQKRMPLPQP